MDGGRISWLSAVDLRYEWRIYIGCEADDEAAGRQYRHLLRADQRPGDAAPAWVRIWWDEKFRFLDEFDDLHECPDGVEDALALCLSTHFEKRGGRGDWVQPAPRNVLRVESRLPWLSPLKDRSILRRLRQSFGRSATC